MGYNDPQFEDILKSVCGVIFLATPHRGSGLAEILNKFLLVSFQSPRQYINELHKNSGRIRDINDQFRLHAPRLQIVSFFETMQSSMGPKKMVTRQPQRTIPPFPPILASII